MGKKRSFDIELVDTGFPPHSPQKQLVWRGIKQGRYPKAALREVAKMFPQLDFSAWRTPQKRYSRYVFVWSEVK